MIEVVLYDLLPSQILEIVSDLKKSGLIQGVDFDFEYHQPRFHDWSGDVVYNRHTVFTFYRDEYATYFKLKYE